MQTELRKIKNYSKLSKKRDKREPAKQPDGNFRVDSSLLMSVYNAWMSLATWRKDIIRNEEFVFGDQHSDRVYDWKDQRWKTERQMFVEQGLQPNQYNIIRNVLRTITGFWGNNKTLPSCIAQKDENQTESEVLTATLHALYRKNELWKLDLSQVQQLLIAGISAMKNSYANRDGQSDVVNDYIDPHAFFVDNTMKDPRYHDITIVGCFYDLPIADIAGMFAKGNKSRSVRIREMYSTYEFDEKRIMQSVETFTDKRIQPDFFTVPLEKMGLARVYEVWRKESEECYWVHDRLKGTYAADFSVTEAELQTENNRRIKEMAEMGVAPEDMLLLEWEWSRDTFWKYYYLTPSGEVLDEGINPYWHGRPPITFELHDFYQGKIYPFVKDLIDANKQINKLSAISELLTRHAAKDLLIVDEESIPEGDTVEDMERVLTGFGGILKYKSAPGKPKPEYINTVGQAFTPLNVVNMYLKLSEQVGGVYGALQGQAPPAGTPAQSFLQQSQNSATSLVSLFEAINSFRIRRDKMNVQLMQQFYDSTRYIYDDEAGEMLLYDPDKIKNIDTEISVHENTNTPAYRLMVNDILIQLKQFDHQNMIDLRGLIEVGNWPFKEKLLNYLNSREQDMEEAMSQGMAPQGGQLPQLPPELQQEMSQYQFDPDILAQLENMDVNRN